MRATPLVFQRFLRAAINLIDAGKAVTYGNLAGELGRAKQVVWKFVHRHPEVMDYVNEQVEAANLRFLGLVKRRHAMLGMQGSVPSAEFYAKAEGGYFARALGVGDMPNGAQPVYNLNLLIPRPDYPALAAPQLQPQPRAAVPPPPPPVANGLIPRPPALPRDIPTIAVR
jgi:hypothetical protein